MQKKKNFGVTKPSALLKKERELKELQEAKEHVKGKIVKIKKQIQRFQDQLEDSRSAHEAKMNLQERMTKVAVEIVELVNDLPEKVKLSRKDEREIVEILEILEIGRFVSQKAQDEAEDDEEEIDFSQYTDEFNRKRTEQIFDEYMVKPSTAEQQNLRKIFLNLAGRFHPDKAEGEEQATQFHEMMQTINSAYDSGDLEKLLALQTQYAQYTTVDAYSAANDIPLGDVIQEQIQRTRQEVEMLESQLKRLKKEKLNLENSELGQFIQYYKDENKELSADQRKNMPRIQELLVEICKTFKQTLEDWLTNKKRPKDFNLMVKGEHPLQVEIEGLGFSFYAEEEDVYEDDMLENVDIMMNKMSKKEREEVETLLFAMMKAKQDIEDMANRRNKKKR